MAQKVLYEIEVDAKFEDLKSYKLKWMVYEIDKMN